LDEQIVLGIKAFCDHWAFEINESHSWMPLMPARCARSMNKARSKQPRCQDAVATEEIDLDLHRISEPTKDIDVVQTLFVIAPRWVVLILTL
jgi:hypothetical protein